MIVTASRGDVAVTMSVESLETVTAVTSWRLRELVFVDVVACRTLLVMVVGPPGTVRKDTPVAFGRPDGGPEEAFHPEGPGPGRIIPVCDWLDVMRNVMAVVIS